MTNHLKRGWGRGGGRPVPLHIEVYHSTHIYTSHIVSIKYGKTCAVQPNGLEHYPTDTDRHTTDTDHTHANKNRIRNSEECKSPLTPAFSRVVYASRKVV